ncbi:50S ribosomal protein L9 [bacterium]|nr:50S ribosomal protein L9 [bacterium]
MGKEIEVLLVQEVKGLGKFGQVKKVALGYARNYLLPYQFAILSTPANQLRFKSIEKREAKRVQHERAEAEALASQLNGKTIQIAASAQETGALYGSVSALDIVDAIQTTHKIEVDRHWIELNENIKEIGEFEILISLPQGVEAKVGLTVVAEVKEAKVAKKSK